MKRIGEHLKVNFIQWLAFAILIAAMFSASKRAVLPIFWGLGRFILPMVVIWLVFKVIKNRLSGAVKKFQDQMMQGMQGAPHSGVASPRGGGQVLDLCPKCGSLQNPGHRCAK